MPGHALQLPLCKAWLVQVYLLRGDRSHAEIALQMRVTESWVQRMATSAWKPQRSTPGKLSRAQTDQLPLPL